MEGIVYVDQQKADKPGLSVSEESTIEVRASALQYVSRGGLKLERALDFFNVDPEGLICIDSGASTGGFSDCLLKRGAKKIYAVDVGYGQLAWSVRSDARVVCMERTNVRYLTHAEIPDELDLGVIDVSFISLRLVLPAVAGLLRAGGRVLCLIKPQFEAGREKVGKKGVVRDPAVHLEVLQQFIRNANDARFGVEGLTFSPIKGPEGNIEYLASLRLDAPNADGIDETAKLIVEQSHAELSNAQ